MKARVEFAYVWREEQDILAQLASNVPDGGVVVEIGTALGGTATILWNACHERNVTIHTVDPFACKRARANLEQTCVNIVNSTSADYAREWAEQGGKPVDLLYIDGDHSLAGIHTDLDAWGPFMGPGGTVLFHDYDPPQRGGIVHLAVRVFLDTVVRLGILDHVQHRYKLLSGVSTTGAVHSPSVGECFMTFAGIAASVKEARAQFFSDSVSQGMELLCSKALPVDSLQAAYCMAYVLEQDFECLDMLTKDFCTFRHSLESLQFLEHAYGRSPFPDAVGDMEPPKTIQELSRLVAAEQVRLGFLTQALRTLIPWEP